MSAPKPTEAIHPCACGTEFLAREVIGVQYAYDDPEHYDGVSEWRFPDGHRVGRWTNRILEDGEGEYRFGREPCPRILNEERQPGRRGDPTGPAYTVTYVCALDADHEDAHRWVLRS